jgi:hypothetical protein
MGSYSYTVSYDGWYYMFIQTIEPVNAADLIITVNDLPVVDIRTTNTQYDKGSTVLYLLSGMIIKWICNLADKRCQIRIGRYGII